MILAGGEYKVVLAKLLCRLIQAGSSPNVLRDSLQLEPSISIHHNAERGEEHCIVSGNCCVFCDGVAKVPPKVPAESNGKKLPFFVFAAPSTPDCGTLKDKV